IEGDAVDARVEQPGRFMAFELERQCKRRFHQPIREVRRGRRQALLQRVRDALPFGWLQRCRWRVHGHLQPGSDCTVTKPRCKFTSAACTPRTIVSRAWLAVGTW